MTNSRTFVYTYARHEDEAELCDLELHALFGARSSGAPGIVTGNVRIVINDVRTDASVPAIDIHRSPFLKRRIEAVVRAATIPELIAQLDGFAIEGATFKVVYTEGDEKHAYEERRELERLVGGALRGKAEMRRPERMFGLIRCRGEWLFGPCKDNDALWLRHARKPQNYSTALPTRAARAIVNIAAGADARGQSLIDPCCGMGTVLIEALSMGIAIRGIDINPLAVRGARVNLSHFGYLPDTVRRGDARLIEGRYAAAIVDMPYNLCSVLPSEAQTAMLLAARRLAERAVIVTTADIAPQLSAAGFALINRAEVRKGSFTRYASVVE